MAELATIARPYAEALYKSVGGSDAQALNAQMGSLAALAADEQLRQFADDPKVSATQVFDLIAGITVSKGLHIDVKVANLLQTVLYGGFNAATAGHPRPYGMPPFTLTLGDADIAALLSYIRTRWGNQAPEVSPLDVHTLRAAM